MKERAKKSLLRANTSNRGTDMSVKVLSVVSGPVGQVRILAVAPEILDRVEFGRVAGEIFDLKLGRVLSEESFDEFSPVNRPAIPDKDARLAFKVAPKVIKEVPNVSGRKVVRTEAEAEVEMLILRRYADGTDTRKAGVLLGLNKFRGLALNRPGAADDRLQHEAAFVNEDDLLFPPERPVASTSATLLLETSLSLSGSVPAGFAAVFDNSSPSAALLATRGWDETLSRRPLKSPERFAPTSTSDPYTRALVAPAIEASEAFPASSELMRSSSSDAARLPTPLARASSPSTSSDRSLLLSPPARPLPVGPLSLASATSLPAVFASPALLGFHMVAYLLGYMIISRISIIGIKKFNNS